MSTARPVRRRRTAETTANPTARPVRRRSSRVVPLVRVDDSPEIPPSYCIDLTCDDDADIVDLTNVADSPASVLPVVIPDLDDVVIPPVRRRRRVQTPRARRRAARPSVEPIEPINIPLPDSTVLIDDERTPSPEVIGETIAIETQQPFEESPGREKVVCPVCMDSANQIRRSGRGLMSTVCGHVFCAPCITESQRLHKCCPTCRKKLGPRQFHPLFL